MPRKPDKRETPFDVFLTEDAARDVRSIFRFIAANDSPHKAARVRERIEAAILGLEHHPEWGARPKELAALGMREYREIFFKPCRVIYAVRGDAVHVFLVADGRRDMHTLLQRRLLDA